MKPSGLVIESGLTKLTQLSRTRDLLLAGKLGMFILFLFGSCASPISPRSVRVGGSRSVTGSSNGTGTCADLKKKQNPPPPPSVPNAVWCGGEGGDR